MLTSQENGCVVRGMWNVLFGHRVVTDTSKVTRCQSVRCCQRLLDNIQGHKLCSFRLEDDVSDGSKLLRFG